MALYLLVLLFSCSNVYAWESNGWLPNFPMNETLIPYFDASSRASKVAPLIINGVTAQEGELPYQVLLRGFSARSNFVCGAALISETHVLTAAHCVQGAMGILVSMGVLKSTTYGGGGVTQFVSPQAVRIHEEYDPTAIRNDIAIISLPTKVKLSNKIQTIRLPKQSQKLPKVFDNNMATISGWGKTSDDRTAGSTTNLMKSEVVIMDHNLCKFYYAPMRYMINDLQICTSYKDSGTCSGDSGGPLSVTEGDGKVTLVGIVSFGTARCTSGAPNVFTSVAGFLPWINKQTAITIRP